MPEPIRVLVADDHPVLRTGLAAILENQQDMRLVGEARDGIEAVARHHELRPDVTLMDLQMPGMDGLEAIEAIRRYAPGARIIVLTTYVGDVRAARALRAGAVGYLLKNSLRTELVEAIRSVHAGLRHVHRDIADEIAQHLVDDALSSREVSVLELVAKGRTNRGIAIELGVSEETVKGYLKSIFAKLDVADRTHAVTVAMRRGFLAF